MVADPIFWGVNREGGYFSYFLAVNSFQNNACTDKNQQKDTEHGYYKTWPQTGSSVLKDDLVTPGEKFYPHVYGI